MRPVPQVRFHEESDPDWMGAMGGAHIRADYQPIQGLPSSGILIPAGRGRRPDAKMRVRAGPNGQAHPRLKPSTMIYEATCG